MVGRRCQFLFLWVFISLAMPAVAFANSANAQRISVVLKKGEQESFSSPMQLGQRTFVLQVEAERAGAGEIVAWNVELYEQIRPGILVGNLLEPKGNWHGLQPFMIIPRDVQEPRWRKQVISVAGLRGSIEVLGGELRPSIVAEGEHSFVSVRLSIQVGLEPPRSRRSKKAPGS